MLYQLILLQLTAHLLADFILQPQKWSDRKSEKILSLHHFLHALVVFGTSYLLSFDYGFWMAALTITFLHLLIDCIKSYLLIKYNGRSFLRYLFFVDQSIHIVILVLVSFLYYHLCGTNFLIGITIKTAAIIAGFILCSKPANIIIKNIFILYQIAIPLVFSPEIPNTNNAIATATDLSLPNAGRLIGLMERFMTLALILSGQYAAVGLIIAAKSILRFNDTQKNEYILVGTMLSFGIAILSAILIANI
ncbi:MAG TPA: DUF3307 domain-containing protein [Prolixibacteraceae bacterium]|jgi:hypothetical protein